MRFPIRIVLVILILVLVAALVRIENPEIKLPVWFVAKPNSSGIQEASLAVLVKAGDALSTETAKRYIAARNIPEENLFTVSLPNKNNVSVETFNKAFHQLQRQLPDTIQALVITWNQPYRVDCMSITSAFTFGFDTKWCQAKKNECQPTALNPYFAHSSTKPWNDLKIRPSMMLSGKNIKEIEDLIARGIAADFSKPVNPKFILVNSQDRRRSSRKAWFEAASKRFELVKNVQVNYLDLSDQTNDFITNQTLLGYQTGMTNVPAIEKNTYLPGAFADHLTSFGGAGLSTKGQMKAFRWLEAGATASYGTVVEPCSYPAKFPDPNVLIPYYLEGETILEAYWKSVRMPGEGLFIGEPLARPFATE